MERRFFVLIILVNFINVNSERVDDGEYTLMNYKTKKLSNEFIVQYENYYKRPAREKFLRAAMKRFNIRDWLLIERNNVANKYPSDFDVIRFPKEQISLKELKKLERHLAIKSVTRHGMVDRELLYIKGSNGTMRRLMRTVVKDQITVTLKANSLWKHGITGKGVKVAVFDTGLAKDHPHFRNVKERTNWTNEKSLNDGVSHGTFVAGVIASSKECFGFAPDAELHVYRVFTNTQVSYTSWFLDAFNYAIFRKINIINLSIGGPDFMDKPFVDKVLELSANKIILVSAIGNDGPYYGTLNNPGDQSDVIGVGGMDANEVVAKFSSRGMTTWELPFGYGRVKPDIVTFGTQIKGSDINFGCRALSGTSVASPVVAGALTLIVSGALNKMPLVNPASMKQILIDGAIRLPHANIFEQGSGKLDIVKSLSRLLKYKPKITLYPNSLDFTQNYMWPYSSQPLFHGAQPVIVNVTILNGITVSSKVIEAPKWHPYEDKDGDLLSIAVNYSEIIWPWTGWMAVFISVKNDNIQSGKIACGHISLVVQNLVENQQMELKNETVLFPMCVKIIPKPPRAKRILWDQYHSLKYPSGYIPRDNLKAHSDPLDWRADHIHTNFRDMYIHLRNAGYYIDVLREPYNCFNALEYGTLLIVDPEEEFFEQEIQKIQNDVYKLGLSLVVFADWYNTTVMKQIKFFDENSRQWWIPDTGGANIPALNELLKPFGISFSDTVAEGYFRFGDHSMYYASGTTIASFPNLEESIIIGADLTNQGVEFIENSKHDKNEKSFMPILGLFQMTHKIHQEFLNEEGQQAFSTHEELFDNVTFKPSVLSPDKNPLLNKRVLLNHINVNNIKSLYDKQAKLPLFTNKKSKSNPLLPQKLSTEGRIAIYGDSNCLDSTNIDKKCFWLLNAMLEYTMISHLSSLLNNLNRAFEFKSMQKNIQPLRLATSNLHHYSNVLDSTNKFKKLEKPRCGLISWSTGHPLNSTDMILDQKSSEEISNFTWSYSNIDGNEVPTNNLDSMFGFLLIYCLLTMIIILSLYNFLKRRRLLKKLLWI